MEELRYKEEYEIDLREYIKVIWDSKWLIVGLFLVAVLAAGVYSQFIIDPIYQTEATAQLTNVGGLYSQPSTAIQVLRSNTIIGPVMEKLGQEYTPSELKRYIDNNIKVSNIKNTDIINITVKNKDPKLSRDITAAILNSFKEKSNNYYIQYVQSQQEYLNTLDNDIKQLNQKIIETNDGLDELSNNNIDPSIQSILLNNMITKVNSFQEQKSKLLENKQQIKNELIAYHSLEVLNPAFVPEDPVSPNKKLNVAIAGVFGLMLGVFIVLFREYLKEEEENR